MDNAISNIDAAKRKMQQDTDAQIAKFSKKLTKFDGRTSLGAIGGLMLLPKFQASTFRLELLAHVAASVCDGAIAPRQRDLASWINNFGRIVGYQEDASEDVFSSRVVFEGRNFNVIEGLGEASSYQLQLVLDVVETMPKEFSDLRERCRSLLIISDTICQRAQIDPFIVGAEIPVRKNVSVGEMLPVRTLNHWVSFGEKELAELGILEESLSAFYLREKPGRVRLSVAESEKLFSQPIVKFNDCLVVALPTGISNAIRTSVINECTSRGTELLHRFRMVHLSKQAKRLSETPMISRAGFRRTELSLDPIIPSIPIEVDPGYWVQMIIINDDLSDFGDRGLFGISRSSPDLQDTLAECILAAKKYCTANPGFKKGLTYIVMCGFGRGRMIGIEDFGPDWLVSSLSAYDAEVLGWRSDFKLSDLFVLELTERDLALKGFKLRHVNGLLAQVGDAIANNGHLVHHESMPDGLDGGLFVAPLNSQLQLRIDYHQRNDLRAVPTLNGSSLVMRRVDGGARSPAGVSRTYCSPSDLMSGIMRAAWVSSGLTIWFVTEKIDNNTDGSVFGGFEAQRTWIERIGPVLLELLPELPRVFMWRLRIDPQPPTRVADLVPATKEEIERAISLDIDHQETTLTTSVRNAFWRGLSNPDNVAEATLVESVLRGSLRLAGQSDDLIPEALSRVIRSPLARQLHAFAPQDFRDHLASSSSQRVVKVSPIQDAALRIGLGWSGVARPGGIVKGLAESVLAINKITVSAENDLCSDLAQFNLRSLIDAVIRNHEAAEMDSRRWKRTGGAIIGLSDDEARVRSEISDMIYKLNSVTFSSRLLLEIGLHHCNSEAGLFVADIDLSRLMARALLIFHLGGYSDAIQYGAMTPEIRISPAGQVQIDASFFRNVMDQIGHDFSNAQIDRERNAYPSILVEPEASDTSKGDAGNRIFEEAWLEEVGADFRSYRLFMDAIENYCMERECVYTISPRKEILDYTSRTVDNAEVILRELESVRRNSWKAVPAGFDDTDRQPWRFRRRLSIPRRPIVRLGHTEDAELLIAPGVIRDGFASTVTNMYEGNLDNSRLSSRKMRKWAGVMADERGRQFEARVVDRLVDLGWNAKSNVSISSVLGRALDSDLGNIDVLSWRPDGRILLLECKHLIFAKTPSEVAKQLSKFRGIPDERGKPDLLAKHLGRWRVARENKDAFERFAGVSCDIIEAGLVFANTVPMQFAMDKMSEQLWVGTIDNLNGI